MAEVQHDIEKVGIRADDAVLGENPHLKKDIIPSEDADMALNVYAMADCTPGEIAAVDEKKLLRKIDIRLMPIVRIHISMACQLSGEANTI